MYQALGQVAINPLCNKGTELMSGLLEKIGEKITDFFNAGKDIVEGLWNGIKDASDWLKGKITGFIDGIKNLFTGKGGFDMNSPSKIIRNLGTIYRRRACKRNRE